MRRIGLRRAGTVALATAMVVATFGASALAQSGGGGTKKVLGTKDPATGTPVKVGFVFDGKSPSTDSTYQLQASQAIVKYLNEYQKGLGGHPIELVSCESGQNNTAGATDCANQLVQANVALGVLAESTATPTVQRILTTNGIPVIISSIANRDLLTEASSTFVLSDAFAAQHALPIAVAKKNKLKKVTAVVIDVPQATELYTGAIGTEAFKKAKVALELVRIPAGQADMTPQMAQIAAGDPTEVHIVGAENFCIAALNGLKAAAFKGPISVLNICATDNTRQAVGADYLKGVSIASNTPVGDTKDPGYKQFKAITDTYSAGIADDQMFNALSTYLVWMGMRQAVDGLTGTVDAKTITAALKGMPNEQLPTGGLTYRCNGKAQPTLPAMCTVGTLQTKLDINGKPVLPWVKAGNTDVPD
jgi:branched-chain amino acid transport system substrate-binding protein